MPGRIKPSLADRVYDVLIECKRPASAYTIAGLLAARCGRVVHVNSVYRALSTLECRNRVTSIVSLKAWVANSSQYQLILICSECGAATLHPLADVYHRLGQICRQADFHPARYHVELPGHCCRCVGDGRTSSMNSPPSEVLSCHN
ncbi:hypothetical protein NYR55_01235 [Sphingomonas sp. BGYR3]|uniref:hypothetical protein n=1 Tax=Sphingomonas sp. BGYR3 TaxID=2975483 RepID=UPI0021A5A159|nr:hypothetical protein [Sphingomonas sp. BGYR3]MDG5487254.1 hypothetical protein [Sphingomonas sp. BGYR3]